ncbi:MAG: conjugal transfer protein TraF [Planctomycetaceae bacterium]|nr:conjugal transfer protein TraF [Planctomycetaceae bacterium]MCA9044329.1 conjugal transfer protein TraF [Planctomycetaceae bacterium]MCB9949985.1 conjugal transfer protein TraF [Planctomycetaceae bacterium]
MERTILGLAAAFAVSVVLFAILSRPADPLPDLDAATTHPDGEWFQKEVMDSEIPVIVDFGATWCGPCRILAPMVDRFEEEYEGQIKVVRIDTDEKPDLTAALGVGPIPAVFVVKNGEPVASKVGIQDFRRYEDFEAFVKPHLN